MYEILVMEYLKRNGDPDQNKFLKLLDYFYLNVPRRLTPGRFVFDFGAALRESVRRHHQKEGDAVGFAAAQNLPRHPHRTQVPQRWVDQIAGLCTATSSPKTSCTPREKRIRSKSSTSGRPDSSTRSPSTTCRLAPTGTPERWAWFRVTEEPALWVSIPALFFHKSLVLYSMLVLRELSNLGRLKLSWGASSISRLTFGHSDASFTKSSRRACYSNRRSCK